MNISEVYIKNGYTVIMADSKYYIVDRDYNLVVNNSFSTDREAIDYIDDVLLYSKQHKDTTLLGVTGKRSTYVKNLPSYFNGYVYVLRDKIHGFYEGADGDGDITSPYVRVYTSYDYANDRNNMRRRAPGSYDVIKIRVVNGIPIEPTI